MPSLGAAEEVHEENDDYDYEDDEFEVGCSCISYVVQVIGNLGLRTVLLQITRLQLCKTVSI